MLIIYICESHSTTTNIQAISVAMPEYAILVNSVPIQDCIVLEYSVTIQECTVLVNSVTIIAYPI